MPRDVATRWNSTYDMLKFSIEYKAPINSMTQRLELGLREYEMGHDEWRIAEQMRDVLEVSCHLSHMTCYTVTHWMDTGVETSHTLLLPCHP